MTGKEKCEQLKKMRKFIADSNGILYDIVPCTHEGPCPGTCPACDAEIRYLDDQIERKILQGADVRLAGLLGDLFQMADHAGLAGDPLLDFPDGPLMGEAVAPDDPDIMGNMTCIDNDELFGNW